LENEAYSRARADGSAATDLKLADAAVPLTTLGFAQAAELGQWINQLPENEKPDVVLSSPYLRATSTASTMLADVPTAEVFYDERLREQEFGVLAGLTLLGLRKKFPKEYARRRQMGPFYHRPPGGENWCDVILRVRSFLDTIRRHRGENVIVVCHAVVIQCFRYLLEPELQGNDLSTVDLANAVPNCSVTTYHCDTASGADRLIRLGEPYRCA